MGLKIKGIFYHDKVIKKTNLVKTKVKGNLEQEDTVFGCPLPPSQHNIPIDMT